MFVVYREQQLLKMLMEEGWENVGDTPLHQHNPYISASVRMQHKRSDYSEWEFLKLLFSGDFLELVITHININLSSKNNKCCLE